MKKQGISIIGIIVFVGLVALIAWSLNYIITRDEVTIKSAPIVETESNPEPQPVVPSIATTTPTIATSTPPSTPAPVKTVVSPVVPPQTVQSDKTSSDYTVTFSDTGFSPASLSVKKGQSVTFVNNSSGKMWVAANPFPSSSEYPDFNQKTGVANGSSWTFTFDTTGVWFYHNHYSPAVGAKIVVSAK